jgi:hypothetical protein
VFVLLELVFCPVAPPTDVATSEQAKCCAAFTKSEGVLAWSMFAVIFLHNEKVAAVAKQKQLRLSLNYYCQVSLFVTAPPATQFAATIESWGLTSHYNLLI